MEIDIHPHDELLKIQQQYKEDKKIHKGKENEKEYNVDGNLPISTWENAQKLLPWRMLKKFYFSLFFSVLTVIICMRL